MKWERIIGPLIGVAGWLVGMVAMGAISILFAWLIHNFLHSVFPP